MESPKHCLNCGTPVTDNFCPHCGQKTNSHRLRLRTIFVELTTAFIKRDSKTLTTIRSLIIRPGYIARNYVVGRRVRQNSPMPLLVGLVAVYTIITYSMPDAVTPYNVIDPLDGTQISVYNQTSNQTIESPTMVALLLWLKTIFDNKVYFALLSCVMNVIPYWIVFRQRPLLRPDGKMLPLNIAEHFFSMLYLACLNMLLAFFMLPLNLSDDATGVLEFLSFALPTVFAINLYRQLLSISWWRSTWLNILATTFSIIINTTITLLLFGLVYGFDAATGKM